MSELSPTYAVLVPVKRAGVGKSRLAPLGDDLRRDLTAAFALDTVAAVLECRRVAAVTLVTDDAHLASQVAGLGARVLPDGVGDDLNGSLRLAAAEMHRTDPDLALAAVFADLPALRTDELTEVLEAAAPDRLTFVADAAGVGTTMVVAPDLARFTPHFGQGSRAAHLALGAHEIDSPSASVRRDVDTPADLAGAATLGLGAHSRFVLTHYGVDLVEMEHLASRRDQG